MALHQRNLWIVTSRSNSSLDVMDAHGGLTAGCLTLPKRIVAKSMGLRVYTTTAPTIPEDYGNMNALLTGIGGSAIAGHSTENITIEFSTDSSNSGSRGVYRIDGLFEREFNHSDALTKGEALRFIAPHGIDEYNWTGTANINAGASKNLLSVGDFTTDVATGDTTIKTGAMVVLPATVRSRGVMLTVILDGTFAGNGPHDFRFELRDATDSTAFQSIPSFALTNNIKKATANFMVYTNGLDDELGTTGFKISFVNNSQSTITVNGLKIIAQTISNPDFTLG